ncbi:hypothetical protein K435DRAFT_866092 [Dendrothele bispora CBS 962.96]|uniref:Uncharacterized protein n=1 Tax=Dendrothele bispora (strain CBS 962.96) TaxID=1314807 RepID=A0A4S8LIB5_DENBC|nr:hypothetical protein K435DRAFT_866092 [Dendrothele bispora CBS 962.96]
MPDDMSDSSANRLYTVSELVCLIAKMCDYSALTNLAAVSPRERTIVDIAVRERITELMTPYFIHHQALTHFFVLLEITNSIVLGTIPLQVAGLDVYDDRTLIVAVPFLCRGQWEVWLQTFGWGHGQLGDGIDYEVIGIHTYSIHGRSIILITSLNEAVVNVVGLFRATAFMNFLTATRLYIGFPDLTLNYWSAHVPGNEVGWKAGWGTLHKFTNSPEWVPGIHCLLKPISWRTSTAVSFLTWGGIGWTRRLDSELSTDNDTHETTLSTTCPCNSCHCSRVVDSNPTIQEFVCALHGAWSAMEDKNHLAAYRSPVPVTCNSFTTTPIFHVPTRAYMSSETETVPVAIVEDSIDDDIRVGHEEFTELYDVTPSFSSIKSTDVHPAFESLANGIYAAILVSRSLIGSLPLDNLVLDTVSEATQCVNMISSNNGVYYGINTDFIGIHYALTSAVSDPWNRDVMLLGSGPWLKTAAYVLVKFFKSRYIYMPFSSSFESLKQYVLSLDCTCRVLNLSHLHRASLPGSISCVVTDIPLEEQIDTNHPYKNMLSAVFDSLDRDSCPSDRGIFLNLGTRHGDDAGWSQMLNRRIDWTAVELPTLNLATVPATWKVLGLDDFAVFSRHMSYEEEWIVDRTVTGE